MLTSELKLRVRYAETDKMGFVYYGNYAIYFEIARVEMLREIGISYKSMEDDGVILAVINFQIKFISPAHYDDLLTVKTVLKEMKGARIDFDYQTFNVKEDLLNIASTTLVFLNNKTMKPIRPPGEILKKIKGYL